MRSSPGWEGWGEPSGWEGWSAPSAASDGGAGGAGDGLTADWEAAAEAVRRPGEVIERVAMSSWQREAYAMLRESARELENGEHGRSGAGWMRSSAMMTELMLAMDRAAVDPDCLRGRTTFLFRGVPAGAVEAVRDALPERWSVPVLDAVTGKRPVRRCRLKLAVRRCPGGLVSLKVPEGMEPVVLRLLAEAGIGEESVTHPAGPKCERLVGVMRRYAGRGPQAVLCEGRFLQKRVGRTVADALGLPLSQVRAADSSERGGAALDAAVDAYGKGELRVLVCDSRALLRLDLRACSAAVHRLTLPWEPEPFGRPLPPFPLRPARNGADPDGAGPAGGAAAADGISAGPAAEHFYLAEGTSEFYRKALLDSERGWIGRMLAGGSRYVPNPHAPDSELYLDMLEPSLSRALARREAREAGLAAVSDARDRRMLLRMLRLMTEMHAKSDEARRKLASGGERQPGEMEREAERSIARLRSGIREHRDRVGRRREELERSSAELNRLLMGSYRNVKLYRRLAAEKAELDDIMELVEMRIRRMSETVERDILCLSEGPARGRFIDLGEDYRKMKLERQEGIVARAGRFLDGARSYFSKLASEGLLPFDPALMDRLGDVAVCSDGTLVRTGDRFRKRGPGGGRAVEIVSLDQLGRTAVGRVLGWTAGFPPEEVPVDDLPGWERLPSGLPSPGCRPGGPAVPARPGCPAGDGHAGGDEF
ncbi:MAG: hypothetical protein LBQ79_08570 [Deltaproteobacteria bacterium]|jgi:hypothetical protein|nr:hypothetical protein [Deltaproteobacteria bacterium]